VGSYPLVLCSNNRDSFQEENVFQIAGLFRHEFNMAIHRKGLWIAYGLICMFFTLGLNTTSGEGLTDLLTGRPPLLEAAEIVYMLNTTLPLIAGIFAADRIQRDVRLNLRELQLSSPLKHWQYTLGKYLAVLLSALLAALTCVLLHGLVAMVITQSSPVFLLAELVTFTAIVVPSFAFVIAFSLACPLVMPLRVYQILFTGYWFWGNFLNDKFIPTISDTLLNASGIYALQGLFGGSSFNPSGQSIYTSLEAHLNILVLGSCATLVLFTLDQYLAQQSKRA
jgi:ABC-2 type transport system permease protein